MLDGTYYQDMCVLIAVTKDHVIDWQFCDREKTVAWEALLAKIPAPDIAIVDGQRGLLSAIKNIWPDTKIQRCYFHIQLTGTKYLTRRPVLEPNKTLRALYTSLTDVDSLDEATGWLTEFHAWYQQHQDFLKHRSYVATTRPEQRPKRLQAGQKSWFVCDQLEAGQMSREIPPVQRLVSGHKSVKNPASYPHSYCVVLSS